MRHTLVSSRRARAALATCAIGAVAVLTAAPATPAQQSDGDGGGDADTPSLTDCIGGDPPEIYGPTDVNAQTANGGLSVALNDEGTVTVLRWPSPSFHDHVRYTTDSRDLPDLGVAPDEGAFLGLDVTLEDGTRTTTWFRDWETDQRHADGWTDEVVTTHRDVRLGLTVTVSDVAAHPDDVFARHVRVARAEDSPVRRARLLSFENLSLVVSKLVALPVQDWCYESANTDRAAYDPDLGAVIHTRSGTDASTGRPSSAAVAVGFDRAPDVHTVGGDSQADGPPSAYDDAADGTLAGTDAHQGHTTSVIGVDLDLTGGEDEATLLVTAGPDADAAAALMDTARETGYAALAETKAAWLEDLLADAPMPGTDEEAVLAVARRALITLVTDIDRDTGAIVASIATQSPYGEDWPRDGAFFDYALDVIGLHDLVDRHHDFYVDTQQTDEDPDPTLTEIGVPAGNWAMNYYADGVVGGPIPWEIDETAYTLWNLWEHHRATGDVEALRSRYPTVVRAADFIATCRDDENRLQCEAHEDDNFAPSQSIVGASTVWLGLDSAAAVADALDETDDAGRWRARRDELADAIDAELWTGDSWGDGYAPHAWPVCFRDFDDTRMQSHLEVLSDRLDQSFAEPAAGEKLRGQYEAKGLLALAKAWRDDPEGIAWVRDGLRWVATEHATTDTHVMGEAWELRDGEVISVVSQPHAWEQVLFYLAALEAWPPSSVANAPADCDGALGALRTATGTGDRAGTATSTTAPSTTRASGTGTTGGAGDGDVAGGESDGDDGGSPWPVIGVLAGILLVVGGVVGAGRARGGGPDGV